MKSFTQQMQQLNTTLKHINVMPTVSDAINADPGSKAKPATNKSDDFRKITTSLGLSPYPSTIKLN